MNSKNKRRIDLYYVENIFLVVIIISLFLAISLNKHNIEYLKREINKIPKNEENMIRKKAKYIAFVYVFASIYFAYVAYVDYVEEKTKTRKLYLIAATILVISSLIRLYNLYFSDATIEGSEDYAL